MRHIIKSLKRKDIIDLQKGKKKIDKVCHKCRYPKCDYYFLPKKSTNIFCCTVCRTKFYQDEIRKAKKNNVRRYNL